MECIGIISWNKFIIQRNRVELWIIAGGGGLVALVLEKRPELAPGASAANLEGDHIVAGLEVHGELELGVMRASVRAEHLLAVHPHARAPIYAQLHAGAPGATARHNRNGVFHRVRHVWMQRREVEHSIGVRGEERAPVRLAPLRKIEGDVGVEVPGDGHALALLGPDGVQHNL